MVLHFLLAPPFPYSYEQKKSTIFTAKVTVQLTHRTEVQMHFNIHMRCQGFDNDPGLRCFQRCQVCLCLFDQVWPVGEQLCDGFIDVSG